MTRLRVPGSRFLALGSGFLVLWFGAAVPAAQSPQALLNRAVADFEAGRFAASATAFDELAGMMPDRAPHLWQRGIALYYAGRYTDCRRQFESHRTVNPDDVENAVWHFLCVARERNVQAARAALLPVGPDPRMPMREVYRMFRGELNPDDVMKAAGRNAEALFYGHLYAGLYFDAVGRKDLASAHIQSAAAEQYAPIGGYMHMVARVHLKVLRD